MITAYRMSDEDSDSSVPSVPPLSPSLSLSPVISLVSSHLSQPQTFLSPSELVYQQCIDALRNTYNLAISLHNKNNNNNSTNSLPQLYTEGFDQEQIWQQLELWNVPRCQQLVSDVQHLLSADIQIIPTNEDNRIVSPDNNGIEGDTLRDSQIDTNSEQESQIDSSTEEPGITNSDDPGLMEEFLQREEKRFYAEEGSEVSSAGESEEAPEQDAAGLMYKDFFEDKEKPQTNYSRVREKMQSRIEQLEQENVAEKSWEMSGEVRSSSRPDNSLLEGYMEHQSEPVRRLITQDTTEAIEEMISRRARDELWDDPVRCEKPKEKRYNYSVPKQVDTQKSQLGLAEVYEQEYLKKPDSGSAVQRSEEQAIEGDINKMMNELFTKLDALSNFRYTPKPFKYEPIAIANVPAVRVEEVLPSAISEATRLAPEEVSAPSRHAPVSAVEMSREDRRRSRRQTKRAMSRKMVLRAQKLVDKTNPGLGNSYSKRKLMEALTEAKKVQGERDQLVSDERARKKDNSLRSSKSFFSKLQEEARNEIKHKSVQRRDKLKQLPSVAALKFS